MDKVRKRHAHRVKTDPDFDYLLAQVHAFREAQNQLKVSLRASERRKQQESIEQASLRSTNRYRQTRDLPPLTEREFADIGGAFDAERVLLKEAAMILHDHVVGSSAAARRLHAADYRR
jgi:carboxyl-terminal processing protease